MSAKADGDVARRVKEHRRGHLQFVTAYAVFDARSVRLCTLWGEVSGDVGRAV